MADKTVTEIEAEIAGVKSRLASAPRSSKGSLSYALAILQSQLRVLKPDHTTHDNLAEVHRRLTKFELVCEQCRVTFHRYADDRPEPCRCGSRMAYTTIEGLKTLVQLTGDFDD